MCVCVLYDCVQRWDPTALVDGGIRMFVCVCIYSAHVCCVFVFVYTYVYVYCRIVCSAGTGPRWLMVVETKS